MCGIVGIIGSKNVERPSYWAAQECLRGILVLQHRGQDAAGILSYGEGDAGGFHQEKDLGLVGDIFDGEKITSLLGNMSIGHTRYATVGSDRRRDLQPMVMGFPFGVGMVHNGNLVNYHTLERKLREERGVHFISNNDLELLLYLWCQHIQEGMELEGHSMTFADVVRGAEGIVKRAQGGYALCGMLAGVGLFGMRDPSGIRPIVLGRRETSKGSGEYDYCLSSESKTFDFLGYEFIRDLEPGEVVLVDTEGKLHSKVIESSPKSTPCMFEWVYFAGAESSIMGQSIYTVRLNLGKKLAKRVKGFIDRGEINPDIVCPVPDTSRTASIALAEELHLPYREGLIKNRYVQRSFILNTQDAREKAVNLKLFPVRSEVEGKSILLVDDSLVRGTTAQKIVQLLKDYGAGEVTLAITCPPLRYPCYYGIDFPSSEDLFANGRDEDEIARWVGVDRVIYLDEESLEKSIGVGTLCMACINNKYPTSQEGAREFTKKRNNLRENHV